MNRSSNAILKTAAVLESASLAVLLLNLAVGNDPHVAAAVGPVHGCLYVFVIIAAARDPRARAAITARAAVPGVGGLLAVRALTAADGGAGRSRTGAGGSAAEAEPW